MESTQNASRAPGARGDFGPDLMRFLCENPTWVGPIVKRLAEIREIMAAGPFPGS